MLGQVLLDQKLVTPQELNAALGKYQRKHLLGDVLIETKAVTPAQLDTALATQRKTDRALADALIRQLARGWEPSIDGLEALFHERRGGRDRASVRRAS